MKLTIPIVCLVNFIKMKTYALFAAASFAQVSKWLRFSWRTFDWILLWLSNEIIFDSSFSSLSLRVFDAKWAKFGIENGSWNLWANDFAPLFFSHSRIEIDLFCIFTTEIHFIFFIQEKKGMNDKMVHGLESNYTENSNISLFGENTAFSGGSSHFVFTV